MLLQRSNYFTSATLLDRAEIDSLIRFERYCRDNSLWEAMRTCFSEDSHVKISWFEGTGHGFVSASEKMQGRAPHKIFSVNQWINNTKAVATMNATILKRFQIDGIECELQSDCQLVYTLVKDENRWMIHSLQGIYENDTIVPTVPGRSPEVDTDALSQFRDSYKCLSYVLHSAGYDINNELPGIDRPDTIEAIFKNLNTWLEA